MDGVESACREIEALTPLAQKACTLFLNTCTERGIPIFITETYRSQARQNYLYEQGRTRPGAIVTWTKNSRHTGRMAWDIAVNPPHALYDRQVLRQAGEAAKALGITWGGDWENTPDPPHFEITPDWRAERMTLEEAKQIVREKLAFDENTMNYLSYYRYGEELFLRIAGALLQNS